MSLSGGALTRIGLLVLAVVVLQVSAIAPIRVLGSAVDLVPLLVAAVALYAGAVPAAATGFAAGLLLDVGLAQDIGASSLVLTFVGYGIGRYRDLRDPAHGLAPIPMGAAATACYGAGFAVVAMLLGKVDTTSVSLFAVRDLLVVVVLNALLALPFFWLVRLALRRELDVDPREQRRRRQGPRDQGPIGLRGLEV